VTTHTPRNRPSYLLPGLSLGGSLLLWLAWPMSPLTLLIFIAWVPLLWMEDLLSNWKKLLGLTFVHMLCWNVLVTWWVANSTLAGAMGAFIANSLLMCIPILLFHFTKKQLGRWIGYGSFIIYWMAFEYIHLNWDLSWPWLTLGNVFALQPGWIQWYEYSGSSGGSLWVLLSNVLAFAVIKTYRREGRTKIYFTGIALWLLILILPVFFSGLVKKQAHGATDAANIVVVQPNIDPWNEKFETGQHEAQLQKLITLSEQQIDAGTVLVVWPETAIPVASNELLLKENYFLAPLWGFLKKHPQLNLLTGLEGIREFDSKVSRYAKDFPNGGGYYETYNSAVLFDSSSYTIYHKSRLVPGVEVLPGFLGFMSPIFEKFGGTGGGYARDTAAVVLTRPGQPFKIAPAVCYESIYGEYLSEFIRKGANLICIITNDGWWKDTPGYKQHMNYARLRAIETRKWIARSANTGISCFIDPSGNVVDPQPWDTASSIKLGIAAEEGETFFVRHGDILSKSMLFTGGMLVLLLIIVSIRKRIES